MGSVPSSELYTQLTSGVLFPLQEWIKKHPTVRVRREMERSQWWSGEDLQALRLERLRRLLVHAERHVPYYRDLFARVGFRSENLRSTADIQELPLLTKADIRANTEALKSEEAVDLSRLNTGGSTGQPLIFFVGRERVTHDVAAKWRATRWWGVDIGDREIVMWGSPIELTSQDRMRDVRDRLFRTELLSAFQMSDEKLDDFVRRIRARRPKMLFGYPSAIALVAKFAEKRRIAMDDLGIKVAFVTAERLYDEQKESIGRVFGCSVANGYGGRDSGFIAHQCPNGGMHVTAEDVIVEIVDGERRIQAPGESGEIVVTHLATKDFPFIRYRTGDFGVLDDARCSCGRGLPLLKEIKGRATDFVVSQDGTVMHGLALIYVVRDLPGIDAFKIVQEDRLLTRVLIVPGESYRPEIEAKIVSGFKARLGQAVRVQIERVDRLDAEPSGKFRYVVSRIAA